VVNDPDLESHTTPLHMACLSGNADCVTLLIGAGAAIESVSSQYGTPLHCAVQAGQTSIVQELLDAGAKKDANSGPNLRTALCLAALEGHEPIVRLLVSRGADLSICDMEGKTAADLWSGDAGVGLALLGPPAAAAAAAPISGSASVAMSLAKPKGSLLFQMFAPSASNVLVVSVLTIISNVC
jgi:hypothetical protein